MVVASKEVDQIFRQNVSVTLSNSNLLTNRHTNKEKDPFLVNEHAKSTVIERLEMGRGLKKDFCQKCSRTFLFLPRALATKIIAKKLCEQAISAMKKFKCKLNISKT